MASDGRMASGEINSLNRGGMAEWTMATVLKTVVAARSPGVRIPLPPPQQSNRCFLGRCQSGRLGPPAKRLWG